MGNKSSFWRIPTPDPGDLRRFGLIMAAGLGLFALLFWYRGQGFVAWTLGGLAGLFAGVGLVFPVVMKPVYTVWMLLARILGFINTHILLALVFYTLFTVIGLIMRLFRHDPLDRRLKPEQKSYWQPRPLPQLPRDHYERQF